MRAALIAFVLLAGCTAPHFDKVAREAAPRTGCDAGAQVVKVGDGGYRVTACGETAYYRCYFKRHTGGQVQCCYPVVNQAAASANVYFENPETATCQSEIPTTASVRD